MTINSRAKGCRGERWIAGYLRKRGYLRARRGQQFSGLAGDADVVDAIPGVHIESKWTEKLRLYKAMEQAVRDAKPGNVPTVWSKANRKPCLVTVRLDDLWALAEAVHTSQKENDDGND